MTGPNYGDSQPQPLPIFVDSEIRVLEGSAAVESLRDRNDLKYLTQQGILQVDQARWQEAQRYERKTWMTNQVNACLTAYPGQAHHSVGSVDKRLSQPSPLHLSHRKLNGGSR